VPTLDLDGRILHYQDTGEGFPLLFGHSFLWDAEMWRPQVEALSDHFRCIVPNLWAHGESTPPQTTPYSIEQMAEDHWRLCQTLELEKCAVIGLSVGGMWGFQMAIDHPDTVSALVLMDTYVGAEPEESKMRYFSMMEMAGQAGMIPPPMIDAIVPLFFSPVTQEKNTELIEQFKTSLAQWSGNRLQGMVAIGQGIFGRAEKRDHLSEISCPTLVIAGEHDQSRPPHESREMAEKIPDARCEIIPNAGHISNLEQPDLVNELLRDFLMVEIQRNSG